MTKSIAHPPAFPTGRAVWVRRLAWSIKFGFGIFCTVVALHCAFTSAALSDEQINQETNRTIRRSPVSALALSPDGRQVLVGGQFGVEIFNVPAEEHSATIQPASELRKLVGAIDVDIVNVHAIAFSPDGQRVAIAGGTPADGGVLELIAWPSLEKLNHVEPHTDVIYDVAWKPNGKQLATVSYDREVILIDADDGSTIRKLSAHSRPVLAVQWLADGATLVTGGVDRSLRVWNAVSGDLIRSSENHTQTIHALAARPQTDDNVRPMIISAGADKTVRFWQPTIGRLVRFARLPSVPLAIAWTPTGEQVIAACENGQLYHIAPETADAEAIGQISKARLECLVIIESDDSANTVIVGDADGRVWRRSLARKLHEKQ
ncbi:MAG: hypothetical protein MPJ50_17860 [Pirellulales bacterium]|nr:hypothetical protein [Pirellulales bacterium]